ncbi:MAG: hypothetical protein IPG50_17685 [Myxococcales bacterium]|nr:hypothetical protein [Myxococcales bacterium]
MRHAFISTSLLVVSSLLLGACAADSESTADDLGVDEGAKKVKTKDGEKLGVLLLSRASGVTNVISGERGSFAGTSLAVGVPSRMNPATGCVRFATSGLTAESERCNVDVKKATTTELKLAALQARYDVQSDSGKLRVDFGPKAQLVVSQKQQSGLQVVSTGERALLRHPGAALVSLLDGEYTFALGPKVLGERVVKLAPNSTTDLDLTPATDPRATLEIKWPTRENPDASHANYPHCAMNHAYLVQRSLAFEGNGSPGSGGGEGVEAARKLPIQASGPQADATFKVFPFVSAEAPRHYEVVVNNLIVSVDAQPGQKITVPVERLDIDDVEVETETGATRTVKGTYQVFRQEKNGSFRAVTLWDRSMNCGNVANLLTTYSTGTGLDVPAGTYRVVVSYTTAEGAKSKEQLVTVP